MLLPLDINETEYLTFALKALTTFCARLYCLRLNQITWRLLRE